MYEDTEDTSGHGFLMGLLTGTIVGAGLALWLTPRAAKELRERATSTARELGEQATDRLAQASTAVGEARDEIVERGRKVRDEASGLVMQGSDEVARMASRTKGELSSRRNAG